MLGKAVKFRHCPATVSAPAPGTVDWVVGGGQEFSQSHFANRGKLRKPLETGPLGSCLGRWLKWAQVRRPVLGVFNRFAFRGGRRSHRACLLIVACLFKPRLDPHIPCDPYSASLLSVPGCVHPRRSY